MFGKILTSVIAVAVMTSSGFAKDDKEDKVAKALEKYTKTGKVENCVSLNRIDSTQVIDDSHILFKMKGKQAYLNKLPHRCARLGFEKSFSYKVHTSQLCKIDIITVFDSTGGIQGPSCGLGKFIEYQKKTD
ncbi:DUF6491 family protein [Paremcibacter congregatus]|uniref:DUF6491 family protein n=1 Tax=Paremcibacter congregatus TaxID=2043170 RepID=UPI0030ECBBE3|tara:strand:+ start:1137 stop:1532 length:396 start_codon:yes stop_codon:yes gene_type:complete